MRVTRLAVPLFGLFFVFVVGAHAQNGCTDSPENPTALLGLVAAGGLVIASARHRIGASIQRFTTKRK
jgi:XrtJ-associated TM-motif-TM protein